MSAELTPAEVADLRIIRGRAMMDRGDIAPMLLDGTVIPWLQAVNLEVDSRGDIIIRRNNA